MIIGQFGSADLVKESGVATHFLVLNLIDE